MGYTTAISVQNSHVEGELFILKVGTSHDYLPQGTTFSSRLSQASPYSQGQFIRGKSNLISCYFHCNVIRQVLQFGYITM